MPVLAQKAWDETTFMTRFTLHYNLEHLKLLVHVCVLHEVLCFPKKTLSQSGFSLVINIARSTPILPVAIRSFVPVVYSSSVTYLAPRRIAGLVNRHGETKGEDNQVLFER